MIGILIVPIEADHNASTIDIFNTDRAGVNTVLDHLERKGFKGYKLEITEPIEGSDTYIGDDVQKSLDANV